MQLKMYLFSNLVSAALDSTASATCQSSNKFGYSSGSAKDSAAFGLTCMKQQIRLASFVFDLHAICQWDKTP